MFTAQDIASTFQHLHSSTACVGLVSNLFPLLLLIKQIDTFLLSVFVLIPFFILFFSDMRPFAKSKRSFIRFQRSS